MFRQSFSKHFMKIAISKYFIVLLKKLNINVTYLFQKLIALLSSSIMDKFYNYI